MKWRLPKEESLLYMTKTFVNGAFQWRIFAFNMKRKIIALFSFLYQSTIYESNDNNDIEYKNNLSWSTLMERKITLKYGSWRTTTKDKWNEKHSINIRVFTKKKPCVNPLTFCNDNDVLMREYFLDLMFSTRRPKALIWWENIYSINHSIHLLWSRKEHT